MSARAPPTRMGWRCCSYCTPWPQLLAGLQPLAAQRSLYTSNAARQSSRAAATAAVLLEADEGDREITTVQSRASDQRSGATFGLAGPRDGGFRRLDQRSWRLPPRSASVPDGAHPSHPSRVIRHVVASGNGRATSASARVRWEQVEPINASPARAPPPRSAGAWQERTRGASRRDAPRYEGWKHLDRSSTGQDQRTRPTAARHEARSDAAPNPWSLRISPKRSLRGSPNESSRAANSAAIQDASSRLLRPDRPQSSLQEQRSAYREERAERRDRHWRRTERTAGQRNLKYGRQISEQDDIDGRAADRIEKKQARKVARKRAQQMQAPPTPIVLPEYISVGNLATALKVRVENFTEKLQQLGFDEVSVDHIIDAETAGLVATEFNYEPTLPKDDVDEDLVPLPEPEDKSLLPNRPPVITIMGHVDHGKTTLLDWLRKSSVVASEYGGITQHIGAFTVPMPSGRVITFLDTPGHAAFLSMRARGANVTDIVILVVAADDSVKPQTIEAIKHAKAAQVPMIVAINKVDKSDANPQRVKEDLARHGVEVEDFGGEVQTVEVSGKTGAGMETLEEAALALADILDVRAPTEGHVEGWVLESSAKRAGKVATVLVRRGTLVPGSVLVAGKTWARVRTLQDASGNTVDEAAPGVPVLIDGWREQPEAGDEVLQALDEGRAKRAVAFRLQKEEDARLAQDVSARNQARSDEIAAEAAAAAQAEATGADAETLVAVAEHKARQEASNMLELPLVLRGDVSGSVEAVDAYIQSLSSPLIRPNILRALVGPATPSDVKLAELTGGALVSFNVAPPHAIAQAAERAGVAMITGNIIYQLADEVRAAMEARLPVKITSRVLGEAEVLQVFQIGLGGGRGKLPVAGVRIGNGLMKMGGRVRVIRGGAGASAAADSEALDLGAGRKGAHKPGVLEERVKAGAETIVYEGTISSLRSHKKEVAEMRKDSECGMSFDGGFAEFLPGDRIQCYEELREKQTLGT